MSSFIGHDLGAVGIYNVVESPLPKRIRAIWLIWLMILASIPDIDYIITSLRINVPEPIRVTHSIVGSTALPILTILLLVLLGYRGSALQVCSLQAIAAGLSHIGLDTLVGVTPLALLWPYCGLSACKPSSCLSEYCLTLRGSISRIRCFTSTRFSKSALSRQSQSSFTVYGNDTPLPERKSC